jgi:hypothetical protein
VPEPASEEELWTNVDYVIAAAKSALSGTHYAGDALPVLCPWLGPDQFAAWLGADLLLKPRQSTSWSKPFVQDWDEHPALRINPDNRWWQIYLQLLRESVRVGQGKWVTGYPDLHSGIDALSAIRGAEELAADLVTNPAAIHRAMRQSQTFTFTILGAATPGAGGFTVQMGGPSGAFGQSVGMAVACKS